MAKKQNIEFVPCLDFSMIKKLEGCLLVFDDSSEEIYQAKKFVKLAVAERHKNVHCIFMKHNLFHQVGGRVPLTSIQLTSFHSRHHAIYNKLIT